jgi:hypothetical protein
VKAAEATRTLPRTMPRASRSRARCRPIISRFQGLRLMHWGLIGRTIRGSVACPSCDRPPLPKMPAINTHRLDGNVLFSGMSNLRLPWPYAVEFEQGKAPCTEQSYVKRTSLEGALNGPCQPRLRKPPSSSWFSTNVRCQGQFMPGVPEEAAHLPRLRIANLSIGFKSAPCKPPTIWIKQAAAMAVCYS